jgi:hypothetical protein
MQLEFFDNFEKYPNINFMTKRFVEAELFQAERRTNGPSAGQTDRQTDRPDEAYSRFSQFCEGFKQI